MGCFAKMAKEVIFLFENFDIAVIITLGKFTSQPY